MSASQHPRSLSGAPDNVVDLPPWFLENCVKTSHELAKEESLLLIRNLDDGEDASTGVGRARGSLAYEIDSALYDIIKRYWVSKPSQTSSINHRSMYLRLPRRQQDPLQARGFFAAVVRSLAQTAGADLVTLDLDDLENLAEHFARAVKVDAWQRQDGLWPEVLSSTEDRLPSIKWDDVPNKSFWIPFREVLISPRAKHPSRSPKIRPNPMVLHIPGAQYFSCSLIRMRILQYLGTLVAELKNISVVVILTDSAQAGCAQSPDCPYTNHSEPEKAIKFLELGHSRMASEVFDIFPMDSSSLAANFDLDRRREIRRRYTDRMLKLIRRSRSLQLIDEVEADIELLRPYSNLGLLLESQFGDITSETPDTFLTASLAGIKDWSDPQAVHKALDDVKRVQRGRTTWSESAGKDDLEGERLDESMWNTLGFNAQKELLMIKANPLDSPEKRVLNALVDVRSLEDTWSDIVIEPGIRQTLMQMIKLSRSSDSGNYGILRGASTKGAVLYGPPGTGKTHLARVVAKESKMNMIHVSASDILDKWVGVAEKFVRALFRVARIIAPSILFIDEADALLRQRQSSDRDYSRSLMSEFLLAADGLKRSKTQLLILLATNEPQDLDSGILRRVPGRLFIGLPSFQARESMFKMFLRDEVFGPHLTLSWLVGRTTRYSGSDIHTLCVNAALICESEIETVLINRTEDGKRILTHDHFEQAFKRSGPTVQLTDLRKFRTFAREYDPSAESLVIAQERENDQNAVDPRDQLTHHFRQRAVKEYLSDSNTPPRIVVTDVNNPTPYTPLDIPSQQIRLLQIKNPGLADGEKVECELHIISLQESPKFTALSYVWGDARHKEDIIINRRTFQVTRNLARALRTVGHHWQTHFIDRSLDGFRLWADAVCINQDDLAETNLQVQMMKDIYAGAELVIASTDVGDTNKEHTETALGAMNGLYNALVDSRGNLRFSEEGMLNFEWLKTMPSLYTNASQEVGGPVPTALQSLDFFQSEHPYFRHVWILQEIVLSRDLIFVCNSESISYQNLTALTIALTSFPGSEIACPDFVPAQSWPLVRNLRAGLLFQNIVIYNLIRDLIRPMEDEARQAGEMSPGILYILLASTLLCLKATDPRDYLYGMLGLTYFNITVDYNKSTREVYRDFCQLQLDIPETFDRSLPHFLMHFSGVGFTGGKEPANSHELPSWAPNLELGLLFLLPEGSREDGTALRRVRNMISFQLKTLHWVGEAMQAQRGVFAPYTSLQPRINDDFVLSIPGIRLNAVVRVGRFEIGGATVDNNIPETFFQFCSEYARRKTRHPTGKPWLLVILQSLVLESRQTLGASCLDDRTREQAFILFMLLAQRKPEGAATPEPSIWLPEDSEGDTRSFDGIYSHFQTLFPKMDRTPDAGLERRAFQAVWTRGYNAHPDDVEAGKDNTETVRNLVERIQTFCRLCWFETADGFIGRGPLYTMVGDMVCAVKGCFLLVLLRHTGESFVHVGPCWVDGLQDGEAADFLRHDLASIEWFELH